MGRNMKKLNCEKQESLKIRNICCLEGTFYQYASFKNRK